MIEPHPDAPATAEDEDAFKRLLNKPQSSIRDLDIDAFADGVLAHRNGAGFHENPDGQVPTVRRFSWSMGWNERALAQRD
jgi:hypothetical protein